MERNPTNYEDYRSPSNLAELAVRHAMIQPEDRPVVEVQPSDGSEYFEIAAAV